MSSTKPPSAFPGILYAGDGMRLAGIGPDTFTTRMDDALPFKALVSGRPPIPGDEQLALDDRLWVVPNCFENDEDLPTALFYHLASLIRAGGKVGLASRDELVCDQARDMLLLTLATPKGQA